MKPTFFVERHSLHFENNKPNFDKGDFDNDEPFLEKDDYSKPASYYDNQPHLFLQK